jgi:mannose-6-phosphate isomerase-like protein (cupin superfamily)
MIIARKDMKREQKEKMRDGEGVASFTHLVDCENEKNIRLLSEINLLPGASIGYHQHNNETEYFLIVSGNGMVNDNGTEKPVSAGDAIVTGNGASHSIKNTGKELLVLHAVIVTY